MSILGVHQRIGGAAHQVLPRVTVRVVPGEAQDEGALGVHQAHIVAQAVILAGFVGDGDYAVELAIQLMADLLKQQHVKGQVG